MMNKKHSVIYPMTFFQGAVEIIRYLLLLSPLMPESCPFLQD